jgi:hypothetical protein
VNEWIYPYGSRWNGGHGETGVGLHRLTGVLRISVFRGQHHHLLERQNRRGSNGLLRRG